MTGKAKKGKWMRAVTTPVRVFGKAKDLYVRSLTSCSTTTRVGTKGGGGGPAAGAIWDLPRSFSMEAHGSSRDIDDFKELVRAASAKTLQGGCGGGNILRQIEEPVGDGGSVLDAYRNPRKTYRKSFSNLEMGRIDEDEPSAEF